MEPLNLTAEKSFLFLMEFKNEACYKNQAELSKFLKQLPPSVRIYAIIHAGMNTLKIYCITNNETDYSSIGSKMGVKTELVDTRRVSRNNNNPTELN